MTHWGAGSPVLSPVFKVNAVAVLTASPNAGVWHHTRVKMQQHLCAVGIKGDKI